MSKTFTLVLIVIGVYVAIIATKASGNKDSEKTEKITGAVKSGADTVKEGAEGQLKYRIGVTK